MVLIYKTFFLTTLHDCITSNVPTTDWTGQCKVYLPLQGSMVILDCFLNVLKYKFDVYTAF